MFSQRRLVSLVTVLVGCASPSSAPDAASTDGGRDAGVSFRSMTTVGALARDCMPVGGADPLALAGSVVVTNTGVVPIDSIHVDNGLVVRLLGGDTLATFAIAPIDLPALAPGETRTAPFTEIAGTLVGASGLTGCDIVPCGTPVRIELVLSGADLPGGARAASEPETIACAL
jgi:hypothetical protein